MMSKFAKIVAIFPEVDWLELEQNLLQHQIKGLSLSPTKGFGEYVNYYARDLLCDSLKLEIYTTAQQGKSLSKFIADFLKAHGKTGGVVAIEPVTEVLNVQLDA